MSGQCEKCAKKLGPSSDKIYAMCTVCKLSFHLAYTRIGSVQNLNERKTKSWKCDERDVDAAPVQSSEDIDDKRSILEAIGSLKSEILYSLDSKIS